MKRHVTSETLGRRGSFDPLYTVRASINFEEMRCVAVKSPSQVQSVNVHDSEFTGPFKLYAILGLSNISNVDFKLPQQV